MYTRERIKEVVEECLQHYTMGDCTTDKEEKRNFVESVMMELDNSNTILTYIYYSILHLHNSRYFLKFVP